LFPYPKAQSLVPLHLVRPRNRDAIRSFLTQRYHLGNGVSLTQIRWPVNRKIK
jgi:hypothetical protein